ncbi:MAG: hypothetical protein JRI35_08985 [Deltaproteobacteria bacterium]|nr:hypothetical protein [Deltaproteobacteria bacterium]MBW2097924.1 hypothetical protein [Deltaproteobacteria bacterium]RKX61010.1 MAG: hypothetical protein DRP28_00110 [Thermodesulfobacteriota bacterium]
MRQRNRFVLAILLFLFSYPLFLGIWIYVKPFYGTGLTHIGTRLAVLTMGGVVEKIVTDKEEASVTLVRSFVTNHGIADMVLDLKLSVSKYSFNVPLTFALITGLLPIFRWQKGTLLEAVLILVFVHLLYIYSYCCLQMYNSFIISGIQARSNISRFFWEFFWAFTDNMVIRFEPFLVIMYLWLRNIHGAKPVTNQRA